MEYRTESHEFSTTGKKLKVLFILNRTGARDAVELMQIMPCDYEAFLTSADRKEFAGGGYDRFMKGTSFREKRREFTRKITQDYDVIILGGIAFEALPQLDAFIDMAIVNSFVIFPKIAIEMLKNMPSFLLHYFLQMLRKNKKICHEIWKNDKMCYTIYSSRFVKAGNISERSCVVCVEAR